MRLLQPSAAKFLRRLPFAATRFRSGQRPRRRLYVHRDASTGRRRLRGRVAVYQYRGGAGRTAAAADGVEYADRRARQGAHRRAGRSAVRGSRQRRSDSAVQTDRGLVAPMSWAGKSKTAIAGIGYSEITRRPRKPLGLLAVDACRAAIEDAGLRADRIDGLTTYPESPFAGAGNRDGEDVVTVMYIVNHLPLAPDIHWYAQIETGIIASPLIEATHALLAGACEYVLVWRALHRPRPRAGGGGGGGPSRAAGEAQFMAPYGCS